MHTMSLYESGDSTGKASISDMFNNIQQNTQNKAVSLEELANFIIHGRWPSNIQTPVDKVGVISKGHINTILDSDMNEDKKVY